MEKAPSTPPPILTNRPFQPRATTVPEDFDDSDFEQHDGNQILTPSSSRHLDGDDDLPPTYEEAQAEALSHASTGDRSPASPNPNDLEIRRLVLEPSQSTNNHPQGNTQNGFPTPARGATTGSAEANRINALLSDILSFSRNRPDADIRYAGQLARRIVIPPAYSPETTGFARAYCKGLHSHSINPGEFMMFIDGINTLLSSAPSPIEAQQALLHLADPVGETPPPASDILQRYFDRANATFFAPRKLQATLRTLPQLIYLLPLPRDRSERQIINKLRKAVWKAEDAKVASKALEPYTETLSWDVPAPASPTSNVFAASPDHAELQRRPVGNSAGPEQQTGTIPTQPGNRDTVFTNSSLPSYHTIDPARAQPTTAATAPPLDTVEEGSQDGYNPGQQGQQGAVDPYAQSWADWGDNINRYWSRWGEDQGNRWDRWGETQGRKWGKWGEDFGRKWGERGENLGRRAETWGENVGRRLERRFTGDSSWDREEREAREARENGNEREWQDEDDEAGDEEVEERRLGRGRIGRRGRDGRRGGGPWTRGGAGMGGSRCGRGPPPGYGAHVPPGLGAHGPMPFHPHGLTGLGPHRGPGAPFRHPHGPYVPHFQYGVGLNGQQAPHPHGPLGHGPLGPNGPFGPYGPLGRRGFFGSPADPFEQEEALDGGRGGCRSDGRRGGRRGGRHGGRHRRRHDRDDDSSSSSSSSSSSDSDSDSDSESSADEAETERFDAEREYLRRVDSIERKARDDTLSLGEKAKERDVVKIQQKKANDLAKAQTDKLKAEGKYSFKMYKKDARRACRAMKKEYNRGKREWKHGNHNVGRREMKHAQEEFRRRQKEGKDQLKQEVQRYKDSIKDWKHDRNAQTKEIAGLIRSIPAGKTGSGWMVWLVVEDLDGRVQR
ncbi:hypothetical protein NA57DRAFT_61491 [Rhizodiscina lignyota]|uniref:Uncharacterized protein n=1 Tax=Rhizodiscina lignyota TaxID=1504668 RepID=A0A9P4I1Q5_9PEZI|nr:hypothetical protein NA57DRAFT_61491 [Rhizodiscina lignyota]